MRKIVLGYDGSRAARRGLERAADLADGGVVTVVSVADVYMSAFPEAGAAEARRRALEEAEELLRERGVRVETSPAAGDPADAICAEARTAGADLVVVGTRGLNATQRLVLGSVSNKVIHAAPCDVLVVR